MNLKRTRPEIKKSRLENEIIFAVVILYVVLSSALLAIHHLQPEGTETQTSSPSPSHSDFSTATHAPRAATPAEMLTLDQARQRLEREGYADIANLRFGGSGVQATAVADGRAWKVDIDRTTGRIARTAQTD